MKELSIEEKAKAYDEAIDKIKYVMEHGVSPTLNKEDLQDIFPELKESEDERISKEIIKYLEQSVPHHHHDEVLKSKEWIVWLEKQGNANKEYWRGYREGKQEILDKYTELEKQGEQKCTAEEVLIKAGLKPYKDGDQWCILLGDNIQEGICGFGDTIDDALYAFLNDLIKSQKEQKPVDKVEPKFHEGEWVVTDKNNVVQIKAIENGKYVLENTMRFSVDYVDKCWRKWDISDANDGDVLTQKPAWSKEDNDMLYKAIHRIEQLDYYWNVTTDMKMIDWLKSLKDRVQPQPNQEWNEETSMMIDNILGTYKTLEDMLDLTTSQDRDILVSMNFERDWIKSLKYRIQPKQEWSEEDERMYRGIHNLIYSTPYCNSRKEFSDWLESLKGLVQPKQEWNEEDERIKNLALDIFDVLYADGEQNVASVEDVVECAHWLKSLRPQNRCGWNDMSVKPIYPCDILYQQPNGNMFIYRYIEGGRANDAQTPTFCNLDENGKWIYLKDIKPQNTWKPSDEQIKAIRLARSFVTDDFDEHPTLSEILIELEAQLKKLREE